MGQGYLCVVSRWSLRNYLTPPFRLVTSVLEAPSLFICWKGLSFPL